MFVAASTQCFGDRIFADACQQLSDLEYDRIEIWMDEESDHLKPSLVAESPERFLTLYREMTRLTPVAVCLAHDVPSETFAGVAKLAQMMRITQVTVPSSPLGTPFNEEIDRLRALLAIANQHGVRLSIKTKTGDLTEDPRTAVELCQAARGLGITLDPSYFICGPHREASFDQVYPYVCHVHLRDTTATELQVPVGLGEIDYSRLINHLRRENYRRALSVELYPSLTKDADRALEMRKIRMLLETLL